MGYSECAWVYARPGYSGALGAALRHRVTHRVYIACGLSLTTTRVVEYWHWCSESKRAWKTESWQKFAKFSADENSGAVMRARCHSDPFSAFK
jgi:hypothetical protein